MNDYEKKQQQRKERLEAAARKHAAKAEGHHKAARTKLDGIPMGQPILVGHHSERRHRGDLAKIDRSMRKGFEASDRAAELQAAANAVGTGGISSDDPDAIAKLKRELAELEDARGAEKLWNSTLRREARAREKKLGRKLTQSDHIEIICSTTMPASFKDALCKQARAFPWLPQFGNHNAASIRRVEQRIAELEKRDTTPERQSVTGATKEGVAWTLRENKEINRCQIIFGGQPEKTVRERLKSRGFRWAPSENAWQRHISNGAWYDATQILGPGVVADEPAGCDCSPSARPCREHEADPERYACPDGETCSDPECVAENARREEERKLEL